ncbi:MAG: 50S ribosomal protein L25/general stress protein Ctc [Deltaproteobacteria bacterium]|nr:50S ribosomal protein L25/general stress protein Ctc [Deltaproteobacteria bacterium]
MEICDLKASIRKESKKGPARRLRQQGMLPAVFYGRGSASLLLSLSSSDLLKLRKQKAENVFIKLIIDDGGKKVEKLSMIKELQIEPVSRSFVHADFYEISMDHELTLDIPLHFVGTPIGVENGGELQHVKRELRVSCLPTKLPEFIEMDISSLDIGDSFKVKDIAAIEGVTVLDHEDASVVTVTAIRVAKVTTEEAVVEETGETAEGGEVKAEEKEKGS